jgi:MFS family permease
MLYGSVVLLASVVLYGLSSIYWVMMVARATQGLGSSGVVVGGMAGDFALEHLLALFLRLFCQRNAADRK